MATISRSICFFFGSNMGLVAQSMLAHPEVWQPSGPRGAELLALIAYVLIIALASYPLCTLWARISEMKQESLLKKNWIHMANAFFTGAFLGPFSNLIVHLIHNLIKYWPSNWDVPGIPGILAIMILTLCMAFAVSCTGFVIADFGYRFLRDKQAHVT